MNSSAPRASAPLHAETRQGPLVTRTPLATDLRYRVEPLEPRLLLSADWAGGFAPSWTPDAEGLTPDVELANALSNFSAPVASAVHAPELTATIDLDALRDLHASDDVVLALPAGLISNVPDARRFELVVVDAGVEDYQALLADLHDHRDQEVRYEFHVLDADVDGVRALSDLLGQYRNLDAVHVVSHGSAGGVQLGDTRLDASSIGTYADTIRAWSASLAGDADLLLYGCDVAGSADGRALVETLGALTGADVAASTDVTGQALFGGDWDLEYATGVIETAVAFSTPAQQNWQAVLSYIEDFEAWSPSSAGTWEVKDLSGGPFNVPANAVLEIAISNSDTGNPENGGVRTFGSTLDRQLSIHMVQQNTGQAFGIMHVQADGGSRIETFASDAADVQFTLLGYWDSGTYVETDPTSSTFNVGAGGIWEDQSLSVFGVGANDVAEIVLANTDNSAAREAGVRADGSGIPRLLELNKGLGSGSTLATMFVQADGTASATIEAYAEVNNDVDFLVMGYWSTAPGTFTEAFTDIGQPTASATWEAVDLGAAGVPADVVADITFANSSSGNDGYDFGVRETGSSLPGRLLEIENGGSGPGGAEPARMHVTVDSSSSIEFYDDDVGETHNFYLTGYWSDVRAGFTVNTFADTVDIAPGDGFALDAAGKTSLRAAIMEANALPGADGIKLPAGTYTLSIAGDYEDAAAKGDLDIMGDLSITGESATATVIDADRIDRVFDLIGAINVDLTDLTITGGDSGDDGGGINNRAATLDLTSVAIIDNLAGNDGGGIYNNGDLTLDRVTIDGNDAASSGGGIHHESTATNLQLTNVTVSANTSANRGGGINSEADAALVNVTLSGNHSDSQGGGIAAVGGTVTLNHVTVADNTSDSRGGGIYNNGADAFSLSNTVVGNNSAPDDPDISGDFTSTGDNLIESVGSATGLQASDITGTDPALGSLGDNGGPTETRALLVGSLAIDAATAAGAPATDQRGATRDGSPDIGAYEFAATVNSAPVASDDAYGTSKDTTLNVDAASGLLANDSDPDSDPMTVRLVSGPLNGSLTINPIGVSAETNLTMDSAVDDKPQWSPDGTQIVFASARGGDQEIYTMNPDGSGVVELTTNGDQDRYPSWSPDGAKIAFHTNRDGTNDVYAMDADGSNPVRLTSDVAADTAADQEPAWSPDGAKIAFVTDRDGNREIYVMDSDGSNPTRLTANGATARAPSWSPDGARIAFASDHEGNSEIYVMDADGTNQIRLTTDAATDGGPSWSPDGTKILFHSDRDGDDELYVMDADGTNVVQITDNTSADSSVEWSPDGSQFVFRAERDGNKEVYVADILSDGAFSYTPDSVFTGTDTFTYVGSDGTTESAAATVTLTVTTNDVLTATNDSHIVDEDASVAGDVLTNDTDPEGDPLSALTTGGPSNGILGIDPLALGAQTNLTANGAADGRPVWSPDGSRIAFFSDRAGESDIWTMNADGSGLVQLTSGGGISDHQPAWSPDGTKLAIQSDRYGNEDIIIIDAGTGAELLQLTAHVASERTPAWSPDGTEIAFASDRDGNLEIWKTAADGSGAPTQLTFAGGNDRQPVWSPDGTEIVFRSTRDGNSEIYKMNADGSGQTRLTSDAGADIRATWSPDGTKIAFISNRDGNNDVFVMNADGTSQTSLGTTSAVESFVSWSPDGALLAMEVDGEVVSAGLVFDGTFTYTPDANFNGSDGFTYQATDGTEKSNEATVTITVDPVNDVPVATGNTVIANEDVPLLIGAGDFNFTDVELDGLASVTITGLNLNGGTLTHSAGAVTVSNGMTVTAAELADLTFTSALHDATNSSFTYTVNDADYGVTSAVMNITVNAVNDVPVASGNTVIADEDVPLVIGPSAFNFTDVESDALASVTITGLNLNGGTLTHSAGAVSVTNGMTVTAAQLADLTFTSALHDSTNSSFTYTVNDADNGVTSAVMNITVNAVNDVPTTTPVVLTVIAEDSGPRTITQAELLVNASDVEGDSLTATGLAISAGSGSLIDNGDGTWDYTSAADDDSAVSFTYSIGDGTDTVTGSATLDITPENDAPILDPTGTMQLDDVLVDSVNPAGNTVAEIVASAGGDRITDPDAGALEGIAVIGVDDANGTWEYSTDAGASWISFDASGVADGGTDDAAAVLLVAADRLRFVPDAGYTGSAGDVTFRAWDRTIGSSGDTGVDVSSTGDTNAFSDAVETATLEVDPAAGVNNQLPAAQGLDEDTVLVFSPGTVNAITVSDGTGVDTDLRVTLSVGDGTLTLSATAGLTFVGGADGTSTMTFTGLESAINAALDGLTYAPAGEWNGVATLTVDSELAVVPVALYTFEDPLATGNDDSPGGANDGVPILADPLDDPVRGNVLEFDGVNSHVRIPGMFGQPASLTLAGWVNLKAGFNNGEVISLGNNVGLRVDDTGGGGNDVIGFFYDGGGFHGTYSGISVSGTGWHHLAFTVDTAANEQIVYVDGVEAGRTLHTQNISYSIGSDTYLGRHGNGPSYFLNGLLDDVRVYDSALPAEALTALAADRVASSDSVTITVLSVNDEPSLTLAGDLTVDEDSGPHTLLGFASAMPGGGVDESGQTFTYGVSSNNPGLFALGPAIDASGELTYTLNSNMNGAAIVTVSVKDSGGVANGGDNTSPDQTFTITVNAVNDVPVATGNTVIADEDVPLVIAPGDLNFTDVELDSLASVTITGLNLNGGTLTHSAGAVTVSNGMTISAAQLADLTFTSALNDSTDSSFTYTVNDAGSGVTSAVMNITVNAVNDVPVATGNTVIADEDVPLVINAGDFNFTDVELDGLASVTITGLNLNGGTLTHSAGAVSVSNGMTVTAAELAELTFTSALNDSTDSSFTYTVNDAGSGVTSAVMNITVNAVNDVPVATGNTVIASEDVPLVIGPGAFNFTDVELDGLASVTITGLNLNGGTLTHSAGAVTVTNGMTVSAAQLADLTFTSALNDSTDSSFTYTVNDAGSGVTSAVMNITVNAVNDVPVAIGNTVITSEDVPLLIGAGAFNFTDVELDGLASATITGLNLNGGTLTHSAGAVTVINGMSVSAAQLADLTFTSALNDSTNSSFTYTVNDADSGVTSAVMNITVNAVNDVPVATGNTVIASEDVPLVIGAGDFDFSDVESDPLASVTITGLNLNGGTLTHSAGAVTVTNGMTVTAAQLADLTFTSALNDSTDSSFVYSVNDAGLGVTSAVMNITVNAVNDVPVSTGNTVIANEDVPLVIGVGDFNFTDIELDALVSVTITGLNLNGGTLTHSAGAVPVSNGMTVTAAELADLTFTSALNDSTDSSFTYTVNDAGAGVTSAVMNITVNAVNSVPVATGNTVIAAEDVPLVIGAGDFNFTDVELDSLSSVTITALNLNGGTLAHSAGAVTVTNGMTVSAAQLADLTFTSALNDSTDSSFTYTVNDADSGVTSAVMNITVNAINDEPTFSTLGNQTIIADSGAHSVAGFATALTGGGADEIAQTFSYAVSNDNSALFAVAPTISASGTLTYTLNPGVAGIATVTVLVVDSGGIINGGDDTSSTQTFDIVVAVAPVMDPAVPAPTPMPTPLPDSDPEPADPDPDPDPVAAVATTPPDLPLSDAQPAPATPRPAPAPAEDDAAAGGQSDPPTLDYANSEGRGRVANTPVLVDPDVDAALIPEEAIADLGSRPDFVTTKASVAIGLDRMRNAADEEIGSRRFELGQSTGVVAGLSVGYVSWLLRGGVLLSSVLSSLPAWRFIDPLPVFSSLHAHTDEDDDDESLEAIVEGGPANESTTRSESNSTRPLDSPSKPADLGPIR